MYYNGQVVQQPPGFVDPNQQIMLTPEQQAVVDVYTGKRDNVGITFTRDGQEYTVTMRQGNENKAGTKHSLYRHYGTGVGVITADDVMRIPDVSWWESEIPDYYEMSHGMSVLEKHNYKVDYIITHTLPSDLEYPVCRCYYSPEPTGVYLNEIYKRTDFRYWFCGHYHEDINSEAYKIRVFYNDIDALGNY